ncbi:MAG: hypothetical protein KatS3mg047_1012 [Bellilinea sp.]|nr:MAG: hypothetical protein KatS3mg047_1012 [Bellilinea sp.]
MEIQEIELTILPDGKVEISVRGVKGNACLEITRAIEEALGNQILERKMTAESQESVSRNSNLLPPLEVKR